MAGNYYLNCVALFQVKYFEKELSINSSQGILFEQIFVSFYYIFGKIKRVLEIVTRLL